MGQNNRAFPAILRFRAVILSQLHRTASAIWFRHPSTRKQLSATLCQLAQQSICDYVRTKSMWSFCPAINENRLIILWHCNLCHSKQCWFLIQIWLAFRPPTVRTHTDRCPFSTSCLMTWASCQDTWAMGFPHCVQLSLFKHCYSIVMHSFYSLWHLHYIHNSFVSTVGTQNPRVLMHCQD